ncbi:MAG: hypothetical protein BHV98_08460 [Clostridium sp. CAG:217_53_7]|nr:MAG: hypothetical protein BHV98_08460 [Clostridium sp. CAG:217_53_7]
MRATYQEITDKMRAAFFDACGEKPEDLPELDTRFRSVATELYALSVFGDHVQSQVFADTARGADLDRHAADVGLQRKGASAAAGVLTFSLAQAAEAAVTVPADTVCSVAGQPYLQFATTKAATIPAGEWTGDVPAVSLGKTTAHNVEPGCITVMVNPPAGIRGVTNANRFSGGAAVETDTALRQRICQVQQVPPNGVNTACLAAAVEQLDRVLTRMEQVLPLGQCAEYTVEAGRPDTIDREKLQVLLDHGVDRISVNPQSLEDHVLAAIGRRHTARDVEEAMACKQTVCAAPRRCMRQVKKAA